MKALGRLLIILSFVLIPSGVVMAQSTPDAADTGAESPFAFGVGSTATYLDARGNPVFEVTVTEIERDWQDPNPDMSFPPERGMDHVAIHLSVTNLGSRATTISPYTFTLIDSMGAGADSAWVSEQEDVWQMDVPMDGGETVEGMIVFSMYTDVDPMVIMFQPDWESYVFIYLGDD